MKPGQPLPPPALPSAGLAEAVLTWPLLSRWPSRAGRPRSPGAREAPGPPCAARLPLSVQDEECPRTARPSPEPPFSSSLAFPEAPPPPRRPDEERGDSRWHRLAPRCALPGPRALCPRAAAAARHMPPPGQRPRHLPKRRRSRRRTTAGRRGLPARSSPFNSRPLSLYLPLHFFPRSLLLLPAPSFIS